ncbi:MAG: 6-phosphofructokinase [Bacteroidales bacterium]|nr:6-phosphofructokinase [Bacteroidales bacterium]
MKTKSNQISSKQKYEEVYNKNAGKYKYTSGSGIAVVFSGGPASGANSVISSLSLNFSNAGFPVIGFIKGFEYLEQFSSQHSEGLEKNIHYITLDREMARIRGNAGIILKTSRANPGKEIKKIEDIEDPEKNKKLNNVLDAFNLLNIKALITIGGDDTLKIANFFHLLGFPVIHIPKTIDNDYFGIPWTFGYWSAVETAKDALINFREDARSTDSYFIVELMGRKTGWITYAAGISAQATMMLAIEDFIDQKHIDINNIASFIVDQILAREIEKRYYGIICVAEGLVDKLPEKYVSKEKDKHGNIYFGLTEICKLIADAVKKEYFQRTGKNKKIIPRQIGYETRCVPTFAFDTTLGCMLGYGAFKLFQENKFGHMVSVADNFDIKAIPFNKLINPKTLLTKIRTVNPEKDFYKLKESLSYHAGKKFSDNSL